MEARLEFFLIFLSIVTFARMALIWRGEDPLLFCAILWILYPILELYGSGAIGTLRERETMHEIGIFWAYLPLFCFLHVIASSIFLIAADILWGVFFLARTVFLGIRNSVCR